MFALPNKLNFYSGNDVTPAHLQFSYLTSFLSAQRKRRRHYNFVIEYNLNINDHVTTVSPSAALKDTSKESLLSLYLGHRGGGVPVRCPRSLLLAVKGLRDISSVHRDNSKPTTRSSSSRPPVIHGLLLLQHFAMTRFFCRA